MRGPAIVSTLAVAKESLRHLLWELPFATCERPAYGPGNRVVTECRKNPTARPTHPREPQADGHAAMSICASRSRSTDEVV
jgi:hypothetical protein